MRYRSWLIICFLICYGSLFAEILDHDDYEDQDETQKETPEPTTPEGHYEKGMQYHQYQKFDEAVASFTKAINLNPNYVEAYARRGLAKISLGQSGGAKTDIEKALSLRPGYAEGYLYRGINSYILSHFDECIKDTQKAIEIDKTLDKAYEYQATCFEYKKDITSAVSVFDRMIAANPDNSYGYHNRAGYWLKLNQREKAREDYKVAAELNPKFKKLYSSNNDYKDLKIDLSAKERRTAIYIMFGVIIFTVIVMTLFYFRKQESVQTLED